MKLVLIAFLVLASVARAADDPGELLREVYPDGGSTLYCSAPFGPGDRLRVDAIYGQKHLLRHFDCITARQCDARPGFAEVFFDLHNYYPVTRTIDLARRGTLFDDIPDDVVADECGIRTSFQSFDPPAHARGNVARAMLYMHRIHGLPLQGPMEMYRRWHRADPPDDAERLRNDLIQRLQDRRNPYIDRPELVEDIDTLK